MMTKLLLTSGFLLLLAVASSKAQDWQHTVTPYGLHTAAVSGTGKTPDGDTPTALKIQCSAGKKGLATIEFTVMGAAKMKNFPFDDFEGPDAPNQAKKTVTIQVVSPRGGVSVNTAVAGWYSAAYQEAFTFGFVTNRSLQANVKRLTDSLIRGASKITIAVQDPQDTKTPKRLIQAEFPVAGASDAVSKTMQNCGK